MKIFSILFFLCLFDSSFVFAKSAKNIIIQDTISLDSSGVLFQVDEQPIFPGGEEMLLKFISENVVYPRKA